MANSPPACTRLTLQVLTLFTRKYSECCSRWARIHQAPELLPGAQAAPSVPRCGCGAGGSPLRLANRTHRDDALNAVAEGFEVSSQAVRVEEQGGSRACVRGVGVGTELSLLPGGTSMLVICRPDLRPAWP